MTFAINVTWYLRTPIVVYAIRTLHINVFALLILLTNISRKQAFKMECTRVGVQQEEKLSFCISNGISR